MKQSFYNVLWMYCALIIAQQAAAFQWNDNLEETLKTAKEKDKPVLVYCYHPNSLKEDKKIWLHPLLQKFSNDFLAVNLNIDHNGEFVAERRVQGFPAVLFFDPDGNELLSFRYEEKFKRTLLALRFRQVLDAIEEFELVKSIVKAGQTKEPRMIYLYAKGMRNRGFFDEAEEYFNHLLHQKNIPEPLMLRIKDAYINMFFLKATRAFYEGDFELSIDTLQQYLNRYPGDEGVHKANFLLGMSFFEAGARNEGASILKKLARDSSAGIIQEKAKRYLEEKKG